MQSNSACKKTIWSRQPGTHSHIYRSRVSPFRSTLFSFSFLTYRTSHTFLAAKVTRCWQGTILSLKLCWHQNMTVTSVKSIKYLHSTAREALDVWQLHTEDDDTPLCMAGIGSSRVPVWRPYMGSRAAEAAGSYFRGH